MPSVCRSVLPGNLAWEGRLEGTLSKRLLLYKGKRLAGTGER